MVMKRLISVIILLHTFTGDTYYCSLIRVSFVG